GAARDAARLGRLVNERPTSKRGQRGGPQSAGGTSAARMSEAITEARNPRAKQLSALSTRELLELMNDEDATVARSVREAIPEIEKAVDLIVASLSAGGRLRYVGAGTSGRLGVLDASEAPPTFGVEPLLVHGIIAGGDRALRGAVEGAEDDADAGARDTRGVVRKGDVLVGLSASGRAETGVDEDEARRRLESSGWDVRAVIEATPAEESSGAGGGAPGRGATDPRSS